MVVQVTTPIMTISINHGNHNTLTNHSIYNKKQLVIQITITKTILIVKITLSIKRIITIMTKIIMIIKWSTES